MTYNSVLTNPDFINFFKTYVIKVVAPASGTHPDKISQLQDLPHLHLDFSCLALTTENPFHSNSDAQRLKQLLDALYDPSDNCIIWSLRGGYGSARLIDALLKLPKPPQEKILIGFSDLTALHLFLSQHWQWQPIHGAGITQFLDTHRDPQNFTKIADLLSGNSSLSLLNQLQPFNTAAQNAQSIQAPITGGNLTLLQTSIGTAWQIQTAGKIVFLEEVGEKGYRIDRSLNHLKQAGLWKDVKALILGEFLDEDTDHTINIALQRFAEEVSFPIFKTPEIGHGIMNYPIQYNSLTEITASGDKFSLKK